jgi:hypothetical protein
MRLLRRLGYFIRHRREEASLAEELALHQRLAEENYRAAGMDAASAHAAARRRLGNIAHTIRGQPCDLGLKLGGGCTSAPSHPAATY